MFDFIQNSYDFEKLFACDFYIIHSLWNPLQQGVGFQKGHSDLTCPVSVFLCWAVPIWDQAVSWTLF